MYLRPPNPGPLQALFDLWKGLLDARLAKMSEFRHKFLRYAFYRGFEANGVFCGGYTNANGCYWEAKREVPGGVTRSRGKEPPFSGSDHFSPGAGETCTFTYLTSLFEYFPDLHA